MRLLITLILASTILLACTAQGDDPMLEEQEPPQEDAADHEWRNATFAGGCFWCMEPPFESAPGVKAVYAGYTGGDAQSATYDLVSAGSTDHYEAIKVVYDPSKISYDDLLEIFWRNIDPTDDGGQFVDRGAQYRSAIFHHDEEQRRLAEESKERIAQYFTEPIVTPILSYDEFFPAEEYHQDYYEKSTGRYKTYRYLSGRDQFLDDVWGAEPHANDAYKATLDGAYTKPSKKELQEMLTPLQYDVTQEEGTETPFENEYWNNTREGIYVDLLSKEPLFSTTHQYKSGTGWPSFTQPISPDAVVEKKDFKMIIPRTEVRSAKADNHLGHLFNDGPAPAGIRYCMNSAALEFIPREELEERGYQEYLSLFNNT